MLPGPSPLFPMLRQSGLVLSILTSVTQPLDLLCGLYKAASAYIRTFNVKVEEVMVIAAVSESQNMSLGLPLSIVIKDSNVREKFVGISGKMNLGNLKTRFR